MSRLFGRNWSKQDLMERVGDASQLGGIRNVTLNDGNENGVRAVHGSARPRNGYSRC
jgi:hypothetical protein